MVPARIEEWWELGSTLQDYFNKLSMVRHMDSAKNLTEEEVVLRGTQHADIAPLEKKLRAQLKTIYYES